MALWSPEEPGLRLVKRVVGLPEELLEIRGWDVFIDGIRLDEPYTAHINPARDHRQDFGPATIPSDSYFMMGDNRDNSNDSRYWGFAGREELIGRALFIYWSYESAPYDPGA
jgi:signal peptidase I